jgi:hypothetical protein
MNHRNCIDQIMKAVGTAPHGLEAGAHGADRWRRRTLLLAGLVAGALSGGAYAQDIEATSSIGAPNAKSTLAPVAESALASEDVDDSTVAAVVTGTGILPASVTIAAIDPDGKVPALDAVPGSGVPNMDVSIPLTLVTHGNSYCVTVAMQDYDVTGDYEVDWYIKQVVGGTSKTIVEQKVVTGKTTAPGDTWVWSIYTKALPDSPGFATLVGRVRWGTGYTTQATVTAKILIQ